jgi:DNA-binding winged helix-turn-helix (wHTH) protein
MPATSAYYEFGDFALDVGQQCLLRRDTGQTTLLTAKVLDTLVYFLEHAGETLDKDVLLRSIWPGTIVEENSLTQNVSTLRQMLGEARGENRYIATIPRRGYRFVAQVTRRPAPAVSSIAESSAAVPASAAPGATRRRKIVLGAGAAVLIAAIAAIALFAIAPARREASPLAGQTLAVREIAAADRVAADVVEAGLQVRPHLVPAIAIGSRSRSRCQRSGRAAR